MVKMNGSIGRCAFTLVELLVVIAIIGVLIATLLPALGKAREAGWQVKCLANLRGFGAAARAYASDNKDYIGGEPNSNGNDIRDGVIGSNRWGAGTYGGNNSQAIYHGVYYRTGHLVEPRQFFCPAVTIDKRWDGLQGQLQLGMQSWIRNNFWKPGDPYPSSGGAGWLYSFYAFDGNMTGFVWGQPTEPWRRGINNGEGKRWKFGASGVNNMWPMMMDLRGDAVTMDYYFSTHEARGFNVLRVDGSARWVAYEMTRDPQADPQVDLWGGPDMNSMVWCGLWTKVFNSYAN